MRKTELALGCLGVMLLLTNCATTDSNGFVIDSGKKTYVVTDIPSSSDENPTTAYSSPYKNINYVNPKDPLMKGTIRKNDPGTMQTIEQELESLPSDYSNEW
ncbi:MAG: hypothetical protein P4L79_14315 [Legionella sp.]|uniref:hypothetical protein n=1 Tax=Legionella sp. TaxID=459 RepID=UPI00283D116E|nr:hypothetical protein [Legionella sp.]